MEKHAFKKDQHLRLPNDENPKKVCVSNEQIDWEPVDLCQSQLKIDWYKIYI